MISRITTSMMADTSMQTVQRNFSRLADANKALASGKRMTAASDDPASSVSSMRLRKELAATQQFQRNIDDAASWMQTADTALQSVSDQYTKAKSTLINSVSGAQGEASLKALAADLRQQAQSIMSQANASYLGRTVFAGNSDKGAAFKIGADASGETIFLPTESDTTTAMSVNRRINSDTTLPANMDGNQIFGTGTIKFLVEGSDQPKSLEEITETDKIIGVDDSNNPSVMNLMITAAQLMENSGGPLSGNSVDLMMAIQGQLDAKAASLQEGMSTLGARHKQVLDAQENILADIQAVKTQISGVEDIDIQAATIEMSLASMAYNSSLSSTGRVVQPSLLDYLR